MTGDKGLDPGIRAEEGERETTGEEKKTRE